MEITELIKALQELQQKGEWLGQKFGWTNLADWDHSKCDWVFDVGSACYEALPLIIEVLQQEERRLLAELKAKYE